MKGLFVSHAIALIALHTFKASAGDWIQSQPVEIAHKKQLLQSGGVENCKFCNSVQLPVGATAHELHFFGSHRHPHENCKTCDFCVILQAVS